MTNPEYMMLRYEDAVDFADRCEAMTQVIEALCEANPPKGIEYARWSQRAHRSKAVWCAQEGQHLTMMTHIVAGDLPLEEATAAFLLIFGHSPQQF